MPRDAISCCTVVEGGVLDGGSDGVGVGVGGGPRRGFSVFLSGRTLGAALTAVWRGFEEPGGVDVCRGRWIRGGGASGGGPGGEVAVVDGGVEGSVVGSCGDGHGVGVGVGKGGPDVNGFARGPGRSEPEAVDVAGKGCPGIVCAAVANDENDVGAG